MVPVVKNATARIVILPVLVSDPSIVCLLPHSMKLGVCLSGAPKGWNMKAQGNALGKRGTVNAGAL
jgi:hypothetical protein